MRSPAPVAILFCGLACLLARADAQSLSARAAVSSDSVFVGEPFQLQIQVQNSDQPEQPEVSALTDFTVTPQGGAANSSSSVTIINGRMTKTEQLGYNFNYLLAPKREGTLTIPPIVVRAGSQTAQTQPLQISARKPEETDNFKLRATLSKARAYVGEPVVLEWVFYFNAQVDAPNLSCPVLDDPAFLFRDLQGQANVQAAELDGRQYRTMGMRKALIPQKAGTFTIPSSTVSFRAEAGFEPDVDFFGRRVRRPVVRPFVVPSNELRLEVLDLPARGRPPNFAGHVGIYQISATAAPATVNVGDPITLNLAITGPEYLEHVQLPPLGRQDNLARDFRVPTDAAAGQVDGRWKRFTQTIRATHPGVKQIPPIELPYFDTTSETYQIAKSNPIPIEVNATKVVTAGDAEGIDPVPGRTAEIQAWTRGIAHNYEDPGALRKQALYRNVGPGSIGLAAIVVVPPIAYLALLAGLLHVRRRNRDPGGIRQRKAMAGFRQRIARSNSSDDVLEAMRAYLGARLRLPPGALTFKDIKEPLGKAGVPPESLAAIHEIFENCEACRYTGGGSKEDVAGLVASSVTIAETIERTLSARRRLHSRIPGLHVLVAAIIAACPGLLRAELAPGEIAELYREANNLFRQGNELSVKDASQARDFYQKSILRFERIIRDGGVENGRLYYNIGNAWFRMNDIGRAILNYRRARLYIPNDPNLIQNLNYARERRADKVEETSRKQILKTLFFWHYDLSASMRKLLFTAAYLVVWVAAATKLLVRRPFLNWTAGISAVVAAMFFGSLVADVAGTADDHPGVIVSDEVVARKGDSDAYEPSFQEPLHAGTEFQILEQRADWLQAQLPDGRSCWLPAKAVEKVR